MTTKSLKLSILGGLGVLVAGLAQADDVTWDFETASGSGPYQVSSTDSSFIQDSSQLSLVLPDGVTASIASGATDPASGNYSMISASSQAINTTALVFSLDATGPVEIDSLSYAAIIFMPNQGPTSMAWTAYANYGGGDVALNLLINDDYKDKASWNSYNPNFNISTSAAATITIIGTLGGADTLANKNGNVGFDSFDFTVTSVPEPSKMALFVAGLVLVAGITRKFRRNRSGVRC